MSAEEDGVLDADDVTVAPPLHAANASMQATAVARRISDIEAEPFIAGPPRSARGGPLAVGMGCAASYMFGQFAVLPAAGAGGVVDEPESDEPDDAELDEVEFDEPSD